MVSAKPIPPNGVNIQRPAQAMGGPVSKPNIQPVDGQAALLALLKVEAEARDATNTRDLIFIMANETRKLTRARQIFVVLPLASGGYAVSGVSSLPSVDRNAPLIILIEAVVAGANRSGLLGKVTPLEIAGSGQEDVGQSYPFRSLVWVPLSHAGKAQIGGLVLAREDAWIDQDLVIAGRLASAFAHSWRALQGPRRYYVRGLFKFSRWHALAGASVLAALFLIHVPLSALAPVEIVARDPFIVASPIDGVVEAVLVEPNQPIKSGDLLVKLADTTLKNRLEVASREVDVAEARLKQTNQVAFSDPRGMHDIGIARAELAVKVSEREFARDLLAKSEIRAQRDGIAVYSDKRDLLGRPVAVGERLLEVADSKSVEARIDLPVADAIALSQGGRVKLFLDSDPLTPWHAQIKRADYKAKIGDNEIVSFKITAQLTDEAGRDVPRVGVRGTAQVIGDDVSLGLYVFRRPITALRQWIGI